MRYGCYYSDDVLEIDSVYIENYNNSGLYSKEDVHDYLIKNPNTIKVGRYPYPEVVPALSVNGEKYIKSIPDNTDKDNLLSLPRI